MGCYSKLGEGISNIIPNGKICPVTAQYNLSLKKAANFDPEQFHEGQLDD